MRDDVVLRGVTVDSTPLWCSEYSAGTGCWCVQVKSEGVAFFLCIYRRTAKSASVPIHITDGPEQGRPGPGVILLVVGVIIIRLRSQNAHFSSKLF